MRIAIEPGVRLFVDIEGAGLVPAGESMAERPTLLLLHGGPGYDHSGFKPLFSPLADVAQIVYYDHRGNGRSDACAPDDFTLDRCADDVVRLCDALGIVKPIVLGQSFGGFVAQRYLARHPAHPAKVVLSSTSHHFGLDRKLAMFDRLGGSVARAAAEAFWTAPCAETWAPYTVHCLPLYNTTPQPAEGRTRTRHMPEILFGWSGREMPGMDLRPGLAAAPCPVLVMAGEADPVTPIADAEEIAAALPAHRVRFERFANVGHGPWRDDPVRAFAVLRDFIAGRAGPSA